MANTDLKQWVITNISNSVITLDDGLGSLQPSDELIVARSFYQLSTMSLLMAALSAGQIAITERKTGTAITLTDFADLKGENKVVYVRPTGNDENSGANPVQAFRTLAKAVQMVAKDFWNGTYIIDITGCTINERVLFPQVRSGSYLLGNNDTRDAYGAVYRAAVNIRAVPTVRVNSLPAPDSVTFDEPGVARLTFTSANPGWTPNAFKYMFLRPSPVGQDTPPSMKTPIYGNGADYLLVPDFSVNNTVGDGPGTDVGWQIVEPGATLIADEVGGSFGAASYIFDGLTGGYTIYGVKFDIREDESIVSLNNQSILFESCSFIGDGAHTNRIRAGGSGLTRFVKCVFKPDNTVFRLTGGSIQLLNCACNEGQDILGTGAISNGVGDNITPVPGYILIQYCAFRQCGSPQAQNYPMSVVIYGSTLRTTELGEGIPHLQIEYSRVEGLRIGCGTHCAVNGCTLVNPVVEASSYLTTTGGNVVTFTGTITVGTTTKDPATLVQGWQTVEDVTQNAKALIYVP